MRTMRPTLLIPGGFQLAATVLLAIVPIISATPSPEPTGAGEVGPSPTIVQQFDKWDFKGCYHDSNVGRTLSMQMTGGINTVEYCLDACKFLSFRYAGLEFGAECWCGMVIQYGRTTIDQSLCDMSCPGNNAQICGGEHHIAIYE